MRQWSRLILLTIGLAACKKEGEDGKWYRPTPDSTALYRVTFEATWSEATHPGRYPTGAHFSPLMGASHHVDLERRLFQDGYPASPGIQDMAERGNNTVLRTEINTLISQGKAFRLLDGRTATASPGSLSDTIRLSLAHPALTVVTMIAPSPDWFAGLYSRSLLEGDKWYEEMRVPATFYDAGTDSGPDYTSPDQPTSPIQLVRGVFPQPAPVGYFRLERIK
ncbi:spondin domain-containing protein [Hymenobacter lucidus]|uniref:Spondin domain-containing protein n=1 Tax=Hymenobacter lucidus TaxID=2880930 RepID=A0ABS8ALY5_9BACT|nr:spondin domain-containing protein [Hymenobacter lucidus]MCB2406653.1 spondin domain-containing protein [Hymenobacter lucidus]